MFPSRRIVTSGGDEFRNQYSLQFDGTNDYLTVDDTNDFSFGDGSNDSAFTVSIWAKVVVTASKYLITKGASSTREWLFGFAANEKMAVEFRDESAGVWSAIYSTTEVGTNTKGSWTHYAFTYDGTGGSTASNGVTLYVNGSVTQSIPSNDASYVAMENTTQNLEFCKYNTGYMNANVDEAAIWNVELSANQVKTLYNNREPFNAKNIALSNLKGYWRMGDGVLDHKQTDGLVSDQVNATLGSEVTTDPSFDTNVADGATGTYWRLVSGTNGTMSISGGKLISAATSGNDCHLYTRTDESPLVSGQLYKLVFTLTAYTSGRFRELAGSGSITPSDTGSSVGTYTIYWVADSTTFDFHTDGVGIWEMSDISVKPVNGNAGTMVNFDGSDFKTDTH